jgi:hypothetical protein
MLAPTPSATPSALSLRMQGFRSAADESAQERVDPAAESCAKASAICAAITAESCDVQRGYALGSFSASNDKDPLLIRTGTPGSLSNIQAHTLGSSQSLIAEPRVGDRSVLHRHQ